MRRLAFLFAFGSLIAACSDSRQAADAPAPDSKEPRELSMRSSDSPAVPLPSSIAADIRGDYAIEGDETRYLASNPDLNGDGQAEFVVHVIGPAACGTGGCTTLVFTPDGDGFRRVSTITVSSPPVRISSVSTNGWRDLIVHVSGGGAADGDMQLKYSGQGYPEIPTLADAAAKSIEGSEVLIPEPGDFEDVTLLQAAPAAKD